MGVVIRNIVLSPLFVVGALCTASARADTLACKALADSLIKSSGTPYHSISLISSTSADGGSGAGNKKITSQTSETIFTGAAIFVRFGSGSWQRIQVPLDKLKGLARQNAESFTDCHQLGDQKRDGASLSVYSGHRLTQKIIVAMEVQVAKDSGLPIESETEVIEQAAGTNNAKSKHVATHYDYEKVVPPVVAP
jgi:hypothetical protein